MPCFFISHSNRDAEQAERLMTWLHGRGFTETFLDFDKHGGIPPGADWERTLYRELARSEAVLLLLTTNWFDSKWCFAEFTQARALGKAIFPLIEHPSGEMLVSPDIQHLDLLKDREGGLERLAAELTRIALNARGEFAWDGTRPPYPGMLAFDEADAAVYFGRDDFTRRLIERLNARRAQGGARLMVVLGGSGSGKSSLIRAGVVPRLERDPRNWLVLPPFRPQFHPLNELAQAICVGLGPGADWQKCRSALAECDLAKLSNLARELRTAHGINEAQILITIDQAEELFGVAEPADSENFFKLLDCLLDEQMPFLIMMALRSDYLGELQRSTLSRPFEEFSLKPMPLEGVRDIIEGPAGVANLTIDDALTMAAIRDAATDDALPLLAFTLRELYDRFGNSRHLTVESYRALGDERAHLSPLENAVRQKAEEVWSEAKPTAENVEALKAAFVPAMVRVNPEGEYVRRPAALNVLPQEARPLIERLAKARLLVVRQEGDSTIVEVVHEALLRKWPLLRDWLDQEKLFLIGKQQLEQDLRDWENAEAAQKSDALLSGLKLTRARSWLITHPLQLSPAERQFIEASSASHEAETAHRERFRKRIFEAAIAAAVALAIVTALALLQRHRAIQQTRIATVERLVAEAKNSINNHLDLALILAAEAAQKSSTWEARDALLTVLQSTGHLKTILSGHTNSLMSVAFSPDGKTLASASFDKTIRLWDVASRQPLGTPLTGHRSAVYSVAFSPDGKTLASASADKTIRLWDVASREPLGAPLTGHTETVWSVAFSPDGKTLASASGDKTIRLWDVARGQPLGAALTGHTDKVMSVAFSPGGKTLASASWDRTIRLWDVASRQPLGAPLTGHTDTVWSVAFSPDGKTLASASSDTTIRLWDVASHQALGAALIGHTTAVVSVAFSPDGKILASGSADSTIRLWDVASRQPLGAPMTGHTDYVVSVAFSPDGKTLASGSWDKTIRLWDVASRQALGAPLTGHTDDVMSVAFSPDGQNLASASADTTIRLWDVKFNSWIMRACDIVNRNLTCAEWTQYVGNEKYQPTCPKLPAPICKP